MADGAESAAVGPAGNAAFPAGAFRAAVARMGADPALIVSHDDADGLAAAAILDRALGRAGRATRIRIARRGESPWGGALREEIARASIGGLVVADLGLRDAVLRDDVPVVVIDHHVPQGWPEGALTISGHGVEPSPPSSLLTYRAAAGVAEVADLLWLAALGVVGDMAEAGGFPEMGEARRRYGITSLRNAAALVNQPRRAPAGDAGPALALLLKADGPKGVLSGEHPETAALAAARDAVRAELEAARRVAPKIAGDVALIRFASAAQVHPLVAQAWAGRLRGRVVLAANTGFRPGWVHFAARSSDDRDLVAFLAERRPAGADENYGSGHRRATGGALRLADWNEFVRALGFGPEMEVRP